MEANLNVTFAGTNGDLKEPISFDATDDEIKRFAAEAVFNGNILGIDPQVADFSDYVVDRFAAKDDLPNRVSVRPKTPFGGQLDG